MRHPIATFSGLSDRARNACRKGQNSCDSSYLLPAAGSRCGKIPLDPAAGAGGPRTLLPVAG